LTLLVRIAISAEALAAISATLPLGSVSYENKTNDRGERYVWLEPRHLPWWPPCPHGRF
jgi:hypothetical protein